ncbi:MAG: winged helix DNA-binding domain-containing protein [Acidimicrobiia bacterium]
MAEGAGAPSARRLNRALLDRQMLLERAELPLPRALERMAGLQAQYAPSMYIGLWSRLAGFERGKLTAALERREVVQATLLRMTIHLVSAGDFWPFAVAVRDARRVLWLRSTRNQPGAAVIEAAAARLEGHLREHGTVGRKQLDALVGEARLAGVGAWLDLVRVPPSGTWDRRRADLFALAEHWVGPAPAGLTADAGRRLLVERYLGGFGPATPAEIADWAGLPVRDVTAALADVAHVRLGSLVDLPGGEMPDPEALAPVRFLPTWDAVLLVHARRTGILPERYRPRIFNTKMPQSVGTFLVDGAVAGTWRWDAGHVHWEAFDPLGRAAARRVEAEAERLADLHRP